MILETLTKPIALYTKIILRYSELCCALSHTKDMKFVSLINKKWKIIVTDEGYTTYTVPIYNIHLGRGDTPTKDN